MTEPLPMYDRGLFGRPPTGASGEIDLRNGGGHHTQYYGDNFRYSWETDFNRNNVSGEHWTNQNVGRNQPGRHSAPPWVP